MVLTGNWTPESVDGDDGYEKLLDEQERPHHVRNLLLLITDKYAGWCHNWFLLNE